MLLSSVLTDSLKVLFVGHSLVGQDMPQMVESVLPPDSQVEYQIIGGSPLELNWKDHETAEGIDGRAFIADGGVDAVILTEQIPLKNAVRWHDTARYLGNWAKLAKENGVEQVWLYETWPNIDSGSGKEIPYDTDGALPWRERLVSERAMWEEAAESASRRAGVEVRIIPGGAAMARLSDAIAAGEVPGITDIHQLFSDDIHPNDLGFYFIAMVQYAALTGNDPAGLPHQLYKQYEQPFVAPPPELALKLQTIAREAVENGIAPPPQ